MDRKINVGYFGMGLFTVVLIGILGLELWVMSDFIPWEKPEKKAVQTFQKKKEWNEKKEYLKYRDAESVPVLFQWDERWANEEYAGNYFAFSGCGPTALSMVSIYLTGNPQLNPQVIADFAMKEGYCENGNGSTWTLMSEGAVKLGLSVEELSLEEDVIKSQLKQKHPIICIMGRGDFTDQGHFIVLAGMKDGKIIVNDPNSRERSEKLWTFEELKGQIRNLWAFQKK